MLFDDRVDAGRQLGEQLAGHGLHRPVVLGLPRGGVPVAAQIAARLAAPVDVFVARKVGAPRHSELGIGAVAEGSDEVVIAFTAARLGLTPSDVEALALPVVDEVRRRVAAYRGSRQLPDLAGRDVVLVDDGIATGITAEAGLRALRLHTPARLIMAAPVCARSSVQRLREVADEVTCLDFPARFVAVGEYYRDFSQTTDAEVMQALSRLSFDA